MVFTPNKIYKFMTLAPTVLGGSFTMMKAEGIISAKLAIKNGADIHDINNKLTAIIPGLPENANDNTYVLFENEDKETVIFALEWLDLNTVEVVESINIRLDLPNCDTSDLDIIRNAILELGYNDIKIYRY